MQENHVFVNAVWKKLLRSIMGLKLFGNEIRFEVNFLLHYIITVLLYKGRMMVKKLKLF